EARYARHEEHPGVIAGASSVQRGVSVHLKPVVGHAYVRSQGIPNLQRSICPSKAPQKRPPLSVSPEKTSVCIDAEITASPWAVSMAGETGVEARIVPSR